MTHSPFSNSTRKFIRKEKARLRKSFSNKQESDKKIVEFLQLLKGAHTQK